LKKGGGADNAGTGGAAMGVGRLEVGEEADGWAPSARERRGEEGTGPARRDRWAGRGSWASEEKKGWRKELGCSLASWAALS
jgi:hypothetical protein